MERLSPQDAPERRRRYIQLRLAGTRPYDALRAIGLQPSSTNRTTYERLLWALERGETLLRPGDVSGGA